MEGAHKLGAHNYHTASVNGRFLKLVYFKMARSLPKIPEDDPESPEDGPKASEDFLRCLSIITKISERGLSKNDQFVKTPLHEFMGGGLSV